MTGRTHKAAGCCAMLGAYLYMSKTGFLIGDIQNILHPIVQLAIMYPAASWGSTAPDLDQTSVETIPDKTPVSILIYKILHIGKIKHRGWQTHSVLAIVMLLSFLYAGLIGINHIGLLGSSGATYSVLFLMLTGLAVGLVSHLIMDVLTYQGIQLVPNVWLRPMHFDAFKTGTSYEKVIRVMLYIGIVIETLVLFIS